MTDRKRYVVGRNAQPPVQLGEFDTLDEVRAFQATLDQDELHAGAFYLDDMQEDGVHREPAVPISEIQAWLDATPDAEDAGTHREWLQDAIKRHTRGES